MDYNTRTGNKASQEESKKPCEGKKAETEQEHDDDVVEKPAADISSFGTGSDDTTGTTDPAAVKTHSTSYTD